MVWKSKLRLGVCAATLSGLVVFTGLFALLVALRMRLDAAEEALAEAEEAAEIRRASLAPRRPALAGLGEKKGDSE